MNKTLKTIVHVVLFVAAFIVFYLGLGIGLAVNPTGGAVLWALAAAIATATCSGSSTRACTDNSFAQLKLIAFRYPGVIARLAFKHGRLTHAEQLMAGTPRCIGRAVCYLPEPAFSQRYRPLHFSLSKATKTLP